jgi:hypothetical protein
MIERLFAVRTFRLHRIVPKLRRLAESAAGFCAVSSSQDVPFLTFGTSQGGVFKISMRRAALFPHGGRQGNVSQTEPGDEYRRGSQGEDGPVHIHLGRLRACRGHERD